MAYSQKRPAGVRSKAEKDGSAGGRGSDQNGSNGGGRLDPSSAARPRGMSDASYMRGSGDSSGATTPRAYGRAVSVPEPLVELGDLQEFGLPAAHNGGRHSPRRASDGGMVLPRLSEDPLADFAHLVPAPPPSMPPPGPPRSPPRRTGSLDNFSDRGRMSPVPVIQAPSPPPVLVHKTPSPPPIIRKTPTPPSRPFSVMSQATEQDLLAIAEMLSPNVDASRVESVATTPEPVPVAELEPVPDMYFDEVAATTSVRDSVSSSMSSIYSSYHRPSSGSLRSSMYTDSDGASYMGDDLPDPSLLSPLHQQGFHGGFHLGRGSLPMPPLDDSRSLSSATSYSSLRTPSLSRHSSSQFLGSPPISPTSSYLPTPVDAPAPPSQQQQSNGKLLGVIEEARYGEDYELHRVPSDDAQTINIATPSGTAFQHPSPTTDLPYLMRKPEPRYPPQTLPLQRRLPELERLRISSRTPDSGAPSHVQANAPVQGVVRPAPLRVAHLPPQTSAPQHTPPAVPLSPVLSAKSSSSGGSSHKASSGKSGLGKLFGRDKHKDKDRDGDSKKSGGGDSVHKSDASVASLELGMSKADEKRLKKEAARARTERLAQDLADKSRKRAEAAKAAKAERLRTRTAKPWEEEGDMYGGISYF
ncbi:hypothetical protein C8Q77DRAFT_903971 [Trametes polyzona]|nr:hypothetical protein C8Q77DRAFT_903971 [Trametes polyzona]